MTQVTRRMIRVMAGVVLLIGLTVSSAGGSSPAWSITKPVASGSQAVFTSVSCGSPSACMAVGVGGSRHAELPVFEQWSNGKWARTPAPQDGGPTLVTAVSCISATWCVATGLGSSPQPEFDQWNGATWTVVSGPALPGDPLTQLSGVACNSSSFCLAVGTQSAGALAGNFSRELAGDFDNEFDGNSHNEPVGAGTLPLAETWNGASWTLVSIPRALDAAQFSGASCPSANWCEVVGSEGKKPVIATFGNGQWSASSVAVKSGHDSLSYVSCISTRACVAVGSRATKSADRTLTESWNGTTWETVASPNLGPDDGLSSVSCTAATSCVAVGGSFSVSETGVSTLIEGWNGSQWTVAASPDPEPFATLTGVSCTATGACLAVGASSPTGKNSHLLAEALA